MSDIDAGAAVLPEILGFKAFADHLGCRPSYVTELRKSGRLVLTDDGRAVRVAASLARIEATRDPAHAAVAERHAADRGAALSVAEAGKGPAPGHVPEDDKHAEEGEGPDFQMWKARRERAAALREELKLGEESRDYLRRVDAVAVVSGAFVMLRASLEALPDNLAPVLAAESDENRVRILLAEEIEHTLTACSTELGKLGRAEG